MTEKNDRKELERRLAQARRMAKESFDRFIKERIERLIRDLEEQCGKAAMVGGLFPIGVQRRGDARFFSSPTRHSHFRTAESSANIRLRCLRRAPQSSPSGASSTSPLGGFQLTAPI
jgi:hypothetical protein